MASPPHLSGLGGMPGSSPVVAMPFGFASRLGRTGRFSEKHLSCNALGVVSVRGMSERTDQIRRVAIVGGGAFGTAIANIVATNGCVAELWMREAEQVHALLRERENRRYLPGHKLHRLVKASNDLGEVVAQSNLVILTVPSRSFREVSRELSNHVTPRHGLVSATKGIETERFLLMSQVLEEECPGCPVGVISGPNIAEEIAAGKFAGTVVASSNAELRAQVQRLLANKSFRAYSSEDLYGVELAGALKNIYAIACGMASSLKVGQNAIAMLITRSLAEMGRLAVTLGANPYTFLGLAGVGDLMVTCTSPLSRNFRFGHALGRGKTPDDAMEELGKLVEGVYTLEAVEKKRVKSDVYMPIVAALHKIILKGEPIGVAVAELMGSDQGVDVEFAAPQKTGG